MPWTSKRSTNLGRMPVGLRRPWILPSRTPVCSKTKTSCMTMTSPSMPWTSVMLVILRVPSLRRDWWTMRSTAEAICSRMARTGRSTPAMRTIVSSRESMSRGGLGGRGRAVVARIQGLDHAQALPRTTLPDDDPVGPHPEGVPDELPDRDRALALDVGRPGLEGHHVLLPGLELGGVLDRLVPLRAGG